MWQSNIGKIRGEGAVKHNTVKYRLPRTPFLKDDNMSCEIHYEPKQIGYFFVEPIKIITTENI